MTRIVEILEHTFRHSVAYPLLRRIFRNEASREPLDLRKVNRVLIFRFDRIGDMIVTTPVFRALKRRNPGLHLGVLASSANAELLQDNPNVDEVYVLEKKWRDLFKQLLQLRRNKYDVVLNFIFNRTTFPGALANLIAPQGFKVGLGPERYAFYFNRLLSLPRFERRMSETLLMFAEEVFGFKVSDDERTMELHVPPDAHDEVDHFLTSLGVGRNQRSGVNKGGYVLLNLSVKDISRRFSPEQVEAMVRYLSEELALRVIFLISPEDEGMIQLVTARPKLNAIPVYCAVGSFPLGKIASIVEGALCVITMDTSIVHFASAMRTPVLACYSDLALLREWSPYGVSNSVLLTPAKDSISGIPAESLIRKIDVLIAAISSDDSRKSLRAHEN